MNYEMSLFLFTKATFFLFFLSCYLNQLNAAEAKLVTIANKGHKIIVVEIAPIYVTILPFDRYYRN